ncbi:MAG: RNA-guided endonuclease InsQ/TnpB family protein, partial [Candidatus Heimdallarchaeota archaeon]
MQRAVKVELNPNNKQRRLLLNYAGTARFAWNWGLDQRITKYRDNSDDDRYTDGMKQHKDLNVLKKNEFNWMYDISKSVPQEALRDLDNAFKNFIRDKYRWRFPRFKKKGRSRDSFRLTGSIRIRDRKCMGKNHTCNYLCTINSSTGIQLPRLGIIRLKEIPDLNNCHIQSATVSRTADRWFVSLTVSKPDPVSTPAGDPPAIVGVDLGLNYLGVVSDGSGYDNPKHLKSKLKKLKRLGKSLSRKQFRSNNWFRAKRAVSTQHMKIANARNDTLHKMTTKIAASCDIVVIEDLNVSGMMKNRKLARSIADVSWGVFRRMIDYKIDNLIVVPRFFPSSKLCSVCWYKKDDLTLSDRVFKCDSCDHQMDRDLNAAMNLKLYGLMYSINPNVADSWSETINACGEGVRP